jgi:hypothetical protein
MSERSDHGLLALDQVEDLLQAYADARLAPSGAVLARMRTAILAKATATLGAEQHRLENDRASGRRQGLPVFGFPRRAMAFGLAATLTLGTTAAVFAAPPGSPFYGARVAIENALVPDNSDARLAAHENRLTQLLADAQAAAGKGDGAALDAALAAYQDEIDAAVADLGDAPDRLAHLEDELGKHVLVLTALEATVPTQAAVQHALDASQRALDNLHDKAGHPVAKPTPEPHPTRPANTDDSHGGGNPNP